MKKQTPEEIRKEQNKLILQRRKEAEALRQESIRNSQRARSMNLLINSFYGGRR